MPFYTPFNDDEPGEAATFNARFAEMEAAISARAGALAAVNPTTFLTADAATININVVPNLPTLQLILALRTDRAGSGNDGIRITFNGDISSNYQSRFYVVDSTPSTGAYTATSGIQIDFATTAATAPTSTYAFGIVTIPLATSAFQKSGPFDFNQQDAAGLFPRSVWGTFYYPAAVVISSIRIVPVNGSVFVAGSSYSLLGMQ